MTPSTDFDWAGALGAAVAKVARLGAVGSGNENELQRRLRDGLRVACKTLDTEGRLQRQESGWTRSPGGIDVVSTRAAADGWRALGVECKVRKPDELLWDAIKVGQRCDEKPWNDGLEAAALVAEFTDKDFGEHRAVGWFDPAIGHVDSVDAIKRWPEAWCGLMCGGRGIRPTSLPRVLRLGSGGWVRHPGGGSALCWRLVTANSVDDIDRVAVDAHGWPPEVPVAAEWRRRIDVAAEKAAKTLTTVPRQRRTLDKAPNRTVAEIVRDQEGRLWADVCDKRETVPTSFRFSEPDVTRYDVKRAKNDALTPAEPPTPLPEWCERQVAEALERFRRDQR